MSFSIGTGLTPVEATEVYGALHDSWDSLPDSAKTLEHSQLAIAAMDATDSLVKESGKGPFSVSISGHANPDFEVKPGWANTIITITISQIPVPVGD